MKYAEAVDLAQSLTDEVTEFKAFQKTKSAYGWTVKKVKYVERKNLMSGKTYYEDEDTPLYLSPASETYWSA